MYTVETEKTSGLRQMLGRAGKVVITSHVHPDGDAVGSTTAMLSYLTEGLGTEAFAVFPDEVPDYLRFIVPERLSDRVGWGVEAAAAALQGAGLLIALDFNDLSRTEALKDHFLAFRGPRVLIDHHVGPDTVSFDLVFSETEISSTCELLYWILTAASGSESLPAACKDALLTGMTTDTNNFANSVFPSTLEMASGLLRAGVDRDRILENLYQKGRENRLRLLGHLLSERLIITPEGAAITIFREEDRKRFGILEGETEGFVNMPLSIGKVRISGFFKEEDGILRVSLRSKKPLSARELAVRAFHGGGHEQAAGGKILVPEDIPTMDAAGDYLIGIFKEYLQ
jgi:phosphoesterase RecJ-like protein